MKISLIIFILLFVAYISKAQNLSSGEQQQLDGLNTILSNPASHDTSVAAAYVGLSDILYVSNPDTLIPLCIKSIEIAKHALIASPSKHITNSFKTSLASSLNNLGAVYQHQGQIEKALEYYHKSLKIEEGLGNKPGIANSLNNLGAAYCHHGQFEKAIESYEKSLKAWEVLETKATKEPIGKCDVYTPFTTHTIELEKGDGVYIFSDEYVDQFGGPKGKKFKSKAFRALLISIQDKPMDEQMKLLDTAFEEWRGELEQIDDVCVIGVRVG